MLTKLKPFVIKLAASIITFGTILTFSQFSYAEPQKFFCGMSVDGEEPATFVRTDRWGNLELIRWRDGVFPPPYTPQKRCEEVSRRFQRFYENNTLDYIRTAKIKEQPVLCVAAYKGGLCLQNGVLITLKQGTDPRVILEQLRDSQALTTGRPIYLSDGELFSIVNNEAYLDLTIFSGDKKSRLTPSEVPSTPIWKQ